MSVSEVSAAAILTAVFGLALIILNQQQAFASARFIRARIWANVILFGGGAALPLYFLSIVVGLTAALPILSALIPQPSQNVPLRLSHAEPLLLGLTLILRIVLWPAIALDWSTVKKWEQEVVRRPRGGLWPRIRRTHHSNRESFTLRARQLGSHLASQEIGRSSNNPSNLLKALGILLLYVAVLAIPQGQSELSFKGLLLVAFASCVVFIREMLTGTDFKYKNFKLKIVVLCCGILVLAALIFQLHGAPPPKFSAVLADSTRFLVLSTILAVITGEFARLLEMRPVSAIEVGSAPVDKKYSILKKITQTAQWLAKPRHLVSVAMQTDLLLTTLRITVSWW
ncbi:MAG: hypothetical protein RLZZ488_2575 [Pseudomonadota bacterium]|jgi:hypothetical protein